MIGTEIVSTISGIEEIQEVLTTIEGSKTLTRTESTRGRGARVMSRIRSIQIKAMMESIIVLGIKTGIERRTAEMIETKLISKTSSITLRLISIPNMNRQREAIHL
jgi:hypothetical protein